MDVLAATAICFARCVLGSVIHVPVPMSVKVDMKGIDTVALLVIVWKNKYLVFFIFLKHPTLSYHILIPLKRT